MKKIFILFIYFHSCASQNYFQSYDNKINLRNTDPYNSKPYNDEKNKPYIDEKMNSFINGENNPYIDKITDPYNSRKNNPYIEKITDTVNDRKNNLHIDGKVNPYLDTENNPSLCKTVRSSWISFYDTNISQDCIFYGSQLILYLDVPKSYIQIK